LVSSYTLLANAIAANAMPCCNGVMCPMHHIRAYGGMDCTGGIDMSWHRCYPPAQAVETGLYTLNVPAATFVAMISSAVPAAHCHLFASASPLPSTPPPRLLSS